MAEKNVESEVTGNVWKIEVAVGDSVDVDDVIMILESMKMEIPVEAPVKGKVTQILVAEKDAVKEEQVVAVIEVE